MAPLLAHEITSHLKKDFYGKFTCSYFVAYKNPKSENLENLTLAIHCHFNTKYINNVAGKITKQ